MIDAALCESGAAPESRGSERTMKARGAEKTGAALFVRDVVTYAGCVLVGVRRYGCGEVRRLPEGRLLRGESAGKK